MGGGSFSVHKSLFWPGVGPVGIYKAFEASSGDFENFGFQGGDILG